MENWSELRDAYGPADKIPELLDRLSPDPSAEVWGELWQRICHQGSVFSASFAAIPYLCRAAASWRPEERPMVLSLAGAILAGDTQAPQFANMRSSYSDHVAQLRELGAESLNVIAIPPEDLIHLLQATVAFESSTFWATGFDRLAGGEFEALCPHCETLLFVAIGEYGFFTSYEDYALQTAVAKGRLRASSPRELSGVGKNLYDRAIGGGHDALANLITYVFGEAECAKCSRSFSLPERIEAVHAA